MFRALLVLLCLASPAPAQTPFPLPLPDGGHAALPRLHVASDGAVWLSWVERTAAAGHRLRLAARSPGGDWGEPVTVAAGTDWFVNWADFPAVAVDGKGRLWAHWLRKLSAASYAYEVRISHSDDRGHTWSPPQTVHDDGSQTEHGFVSLLPRGDGGVVIAWLDGRQTAPQATPARIGGGHPDHGPGAMTLRAARIGVGGKDGEWLLDPRTCDCCQTAAAMTSRGPAVVYRGRDEREIRDILITRFDGAQWTPPRKVHDDGWRMPACPVNGPAATASGDSLWVAWYTVGPGVPTVRLAYSADAGERFDAVRDLASGPGVLGRVALVHSGNAVWVAWLEEDEDGQSLWLARADHRLESLQRMELARPAGRGRATGFPQLAVQGSELLVVWTDVAAGQPGLLGARVALDQALEFDAPLVQHGRPRWLLGRH